ncbi:MAG: hypothetical protein MUF58_11820 [Arcicella sp.]|jgi:flagellar hook-associated protein FlgK|nr:hypothetical protein [Arcicella sp.]
MKEINLQELAFEFLMKLDSKFSDREQAEILTILNKVIDTFSEVIKHFLDPEKRDELLKQGEALFNQHKDTIQEIGFQIEEKVS